MWLLTAWLLLATGIGLAWRREMRRLERERRRKALLASAPFRQVAQDFERMKAQIGYALIPTVRRAAVAMETYSRALRDSDLKRVNQYRKGGT